MVTFCVVIIIIWWLDRKSPHGHYHRLGESGKEGFTLLGACLLVINGRSTDIKAEREGRVNRKKGESLEQLRIKFWPAMEMTSVKFCILFLYMVWVIFQYFPSSFPYLSSPRHLPFSVYDKDKNQLFLQSTSLWHPRAIDLCGVFVIIGIIFQSSLNHSWEE